MVVEHGPNALGYNYDIGERGPIYAAASGEGHSCLFAVRDPDFPQGAAGHPTEATIMDPELLQELRH